MNLKNSLFAGLFAAALGVAAVGCNSNPTSSTTSVSAPTSLQASSASSSAVHLTWTAPTSATTATTYNISWTGAATGSTTSATTSVDVTNLTAGLYQFSVVAKDSAGNLSAADTLSWAPAARYTNDAVYSATIQIYERDAVGVGSAIAIDPSLGGPTNVSVVAGTPGMGQLAAFFKTDGTVDVGPLYAITDYAVSAHLDLSKVDTTVYVSTNKYSVTSMDTWFSSQPLSADIQLTSPGAGNVRAFNLASSAGPTGFYVRTGLPGAYHYARVLVRSTNGSIIQTTSQGYKYIELEISYQTQPNLPYAKSNAKFAAPAVSGASTVRR